MAIKKFIRYPDKRLSVKCELISSVTDKDHEVWKNMFDSMYNMPGIGLAACQIGILRSLAVVDVGDGKIEPFEMANPTLAVLDWKRRAIMTLRTAFLNRSSPL